MREVNRGKIPKTHKFTRIMGYSVQDDGETEKTTIVIPRKPIYYDKIMPAFKQMPDSIDGNYRVIIVISSW